MTRAGIGAVLASIRSIVWTLLGVAVAAAVVAVVAWLAGRTDASAQARGQIVSGVALVAVSILLFMTGQRTYAAAEDGLALGEGENRRTWRVGERIQQSEYDQLSAADKRNKVRAQRGLYFRALYVGADGRWSTSKVQALLWTYAFLYALLAYFIADSIGLPAGNSSFGNLEFHENYLLLLGGPFAAVVAAKAITSQRAEDGATVKTTSDTPDHQDVGQGLREVVADDDGRTDLADFQYFMFNLLAFAVFLVTFVPHLEGGLPRLPDYLVALTSLAALTYLGKKAVDRKTPAITMLVPKQVRPGASFTVYGTYLTTPDQPPTVTVAGREATATIERKPRVPGDDVVLCVTVSPEAPAGENQEVVIRPGDAAATATDHIDITSTTVTSVEPSPPTWAPGAQLSINGTGFGVPENLGKPDAKVTFDGRELRVVEQRDTRLRTTVPTDLGTPTVTTPELKVTPNEGEPYTASIALAPMAVTGATPSPLVLVAGAAMKVSGSGFGPAPANTADGIVRLGAEEVPWSSWTDTEIAATVPSPVPTKLVKQANAKAALTVERGGRTSQQFQADLALPSIIIDTVTPLPVPLRQGARVFITGTGFGAPSDPYTPTVTLGALDLEVVARADTLLTTTLPAAATRPAYDTDTLTVQRNGYKAAVKPVAVKE